MKRRKKSFKPNLFPQSTSAHLEYILPHNSSWWDNWCLL